MSSLIGIAGIFYGLRFVFLTESKGFTGYLDVSSLILLGILPPSIMLLSHKISDFFTGFKILIQSSLQNTIRTQNNVIDALTMCSARVRSEGIGGLVKERKKN